MSDIFDSNRVKHWRGKALHDAYVKMPADELQALCNLALQAIMMKDSYYELIMAVARKFPNETRHQTALRYIKACEDTQGVEQKAATPTEGASPHA